MRARAHRTVVVKTLKEGCTSAASNSSSYVYSSGVQRGAAPYKGVIGCLQISPLFSVGGKKRFVAVLDGFKTAGLPRKGLQRNLVTMASQAVPAFIRQDSMVQSDATTSL